MRRIRFAAVFASACALAGCVAQPARRFEPAPPEIATATGRAASAELARLEALLRQAPSAEAPPLADPSFAGGAWARKTLRATGEGAPPSSFPSQEARRLAAKRAAVGAGWRDLAGQIESLALPGGNTVGQFAAADAALRQNVEGLIRAARIADESEQPDGSAIVTLELDIAPLAEWIPLPDGAAAEAQSASAVQAVQWMGERQMLFAQLQRQAEAAARQNLLQIVGAAALAPDYTVGRAMAAAPGLREQIEAMVSTAPVTASRYYAETGECQVDLQFNLGQAKRMAADARAFSAPAPLP